MTDAPLTVSGDLLTLTITVAAYQTADAVGIVLPGNDEDGPITLLDEDLVLARQAALDAFVTALRGNRDVYAAGADLVVGTTKLPAPSTIPEPF